MNVKSTPQKQLPDVDYEKYQTSFHGNRSNWWSRPLDSIAGRHGLDLSSPERSTSGRNVVLLAGDWVVKLVPPFWGRMWERECVALQHVHGRLSARTPVFQAAGSIGSWSYLVMERIDGISLGWRGELGSPTDRLELAVQQGRLAREISRLPAVEALRWDWSGVLEEDRRDMVAGLADTSPPLSASAEDYVAEAGDLSSGNTLLHGDLASINLLKGDRGDLALIDWSDASVGPADHEFISPFMHQFRGDPQGLEGFWTGFGDVEDPTSLRHRIMARSIVKYATLMAGYLDDLPGSVPVSWPEAAERFTLIP